MPPKQKGSRAERGRTSNRQGAGTSVLRAIRFHGRQYFNGRTFELINDGVVEVQSVARRDGFICRRNGKLRHIDAGCGQGCTCINCLAAPRKYEPAPATVETCPCIRCERRRASRVRGG